MKNHSTSFSRYAILLLVLVSLACNLTTPSGLKSTPALTATPSVPLPPGIAETYPLNGSELSLKGSLTVYFNQPMDRASVESSLQSDSADFSPNFNWSDDATVIITSKNNLKPASLLNYFLK